MLKLTINLTRGFCRETSKLLPSKWSLKINKGKIGEFKIFISSGPSAYISGKLSFVAWRCVCWFSLFYGWILRTHEQFYSKLYGICMLRVQTIVLDRLSNFSFVVFQCICWCMCWWFRYWYYFHKSLYVCVCVCVYFYS